MMKVLFLRGQVPADRDPKEIVFDKLSDNDDMWTHLAYELSKNGQGEIWYWGGKRNHLFADNFVERWIPSFDMDRHDFEAEVIFCRGGFKPYDQVLRRHPKAFKIYYGAGVRFLPQFGFRDYDLILVDSERQLQEARQKFPSVKSDLLIKPAAENIFKPRKKEIIYDIIFVVNHARMKGLDFFLENLPKDLKALVVGNTPKNIVSRYPHVKFTRRRLARKELPDFYAQAKVSVCCSTSYDSCPRVIPESLACDTPIVCLDSVHVWREKYINNFTGKVVNSGNFFQAIRDVMANISDYAPRTYYEENLSLKKCADKILENL